MNEYTEGMFSSEMAEMREEIRLNKVRIADLEKQKEAAMKALQVVEALVVEVMADNQQDKRLVGMLSLVKRYVVTQFHEIDAMDIPF